jgi:hypothetical protein
MKIVPKKGKLPNNSKWFPSKEQLNALENVDRSIGSTISYVFETKRIIFTSDFPTGEEVVKRSILHTPINPTIFFSLHNGKKSKRSNNEILELFADTAWDLGATTFIIN